MQSIFRHKQIALLAVLLLGHVVSTLHVTTHISIDQPACEFCAQNGNPAHAITPPAVATLLPAAFYPVAEYRSATQPVLEIVAYRERAPPVTT